MRNLNKHHREIFLDKFKDLLEKKHKNLQFFNHLNSELKKAETKSQEEAINASIDFRLFENNSIQNQIEEIEEILKTNIIL